MTLASRLGWSPRQPRERSCTSSRRLRAAAWVRSSRTSCSTCRGHAVDARSFVRRGLARGGRRDVRAAARHLRSCTFGSVVVRAVRRRRLHRRGLLVHELDELRQSGRDDRPLVDQHVRGHQPFVRAHVRDRTARRWRRLDHVLRLPLSHRSRGLMTVPSVLFLCVHNAGRSQMAAGVGSNISRPASGRVRSGGSEPASEVNPRARRSHGRSRDRHHARGSEAMVRRGPRRGRRGGDDGMRRLVPVHPRQALRGLGGRRPG